MRVFNIFPVQYIANEFRVKRFHCLQASAKSDKGRRFSAEMAAETGNCGARVEESTQAQVISKSHAMCCVVGCTSTALPGLISLHVFPKCSKLRKLRSLEKMLPSTNVDKRSAHAAARAASGDTGKRTDREAEKELTAAEMLLELSSVKEVKNSRSVIGAKLGQQNIRGRWTIQSFYHLHIT
ncbi:uncharacterized protein LOC111624440 [Centruroides sculpturatus]|uniref:uncharacterized protein LOC111624440 n=1 Tax=Centruroides sculpturatus TaxID=218467 RepID=UPI000C6E09DE|nr:uncharacterized protein LOC111624440 [Centruroides sculpturatus]